MIRGWGREERGEILSNLLASIREKSRIWLLPNHADIVAKCRYLVFFCSGNPDVSFPLSFTLWPPAAPGTSPLYWQNSCGNLIPHTLLFRRMWGCSVRITYGRERKLPFFPPEAPRNIFYFHWLWLVYVPIPEPVVVGKTCCLAYINQDPPPELLTQTLREWRRTVFSKGTWGPAPGGWCLKSTTGICLLQELWKVKAPRRS